MKPIFLIGYMCSGKSTLGHALEQRAAVRYVDLDEMIESEQHMSISEIFATRGEAAFRALESEALARAARLTDVVVGCGGGTACNPANMTLMNERGHTVLLEASRPRLLNRLLEGRAKRPRIAALDDVAIQALMDEDMERRREHYEQAKSRFDSSFLETESEVAATVNRFVTLYNIPLR